MPNEFGDSPVASANEFGDTPVQAHAPASDQPPADSDSFAGKVGHAIGNWWEQVNPVAQYKALGDTLQQAVTHPAQLLTKIGEANDAPRVAAADAFNRGDYVEGVRHGLNWLLNAVPGVGTTMEKASDEAQSGDLAGGIGTTAGVLTNLAAPAVLPKVAGAVSEVVAPAERATAKALYQSSLKPSQVDPTKAAAAVKTGLESEIPISETGQNKLAELVNDLSSKVRAVIASDPAATVDPQKIASRLDQTKGKFSNQVLPQNDLDIIDKAKQDFTAANPNPIPATDAQTMKQGTYQQLKSKAFGELKAAQTESEKALARGAKEELETVFPELKQLNADQAKLYGLEPFLEKAVARIGNHNIVSLGDMVAGGAGAAVAGAPAAIATAVLRHIVGDPAVKSRLAIMLNNAAKNAGSPLSLASSAARVDGYLQALGSASRAVADPATGMPGVGVPVPLAASGNQEQQ